MTGVPDRGRRADLPLTTVRQWPGMRSEYSWLPPHDHVTVTKPYQIGVSFTSHRNVVQEREGRAVELDVVAGDVFATGPQRVAWANVREPTEAIEIYPDPALLRAAVPSSQARQLQIEPVSGARDATSQYRTGEVAYVPAVAPDMTSGLAFMPNEEATSYYLRTSAADAPSWANQVVAKSLLAYFTYNGVSHAALLEPTPLLVVHGTTDNFLLPQFAQAAYDAATGPKDLVWIDTHNHIELYDQRPYVSKAVDVLIPWLQQHLDGPGQVR